jgi:hypothetical protein
LESIAGELAVLGLKGAPRNGYNTIFVPRSESFSHALSKILKGLRDTIKNRLASQPLSIITANAYQEPHFMPELLR